MMSRMATLQELPRRVARRIRRELVARGEKRRVMRRPTLAAPTEGGGAAFERRFAFLDAAFVAALARDFPGQVEVVRQEAEQAIAHRFDLLGSGPTVVAHGCVCAGHGGVVYAAHEAVQADAEGRWLAGRINCANLDAAQRIWQLVGGPYVPIDWQLDFRSGFRWREDCWHRDIRFGHLPGVDVKLPWELTRVQQLPALALAAHFARAGLAGFRPRDAYAVEFRRQVLDFIATNPPGFGVGWACPMDVAIRAANLLIARDMLVAADHAFDPAFEAIFASNMLAHGRHLVANLEWAPRFRGNHYLADIVGLLALAIYLPCDAETDAWLAFAVQELLAELDYQFHEDGSNFEASVCYHRLSAEMVSWAFALLAALAPHKREALRRIQRHPRLPRLRPQPVPVESPAQSAHGWPVPDRAWRRLQRMADFTAAMTRPDGLVVQFGDNDSGRFVCVGSAERLADGGRPGAAWSLDHSSLIAGVDALTNRTADAATHDIASRLLRGLAGGQCGAAGAVPTELSPSASLRIGDERVWADLTTQRAGTPARSRWTSAFPAPARDSDASLLQGLSCSAFPGAGCYVFRSPRLYLAIRCGEIGLAGLGAHAHHDQLGIELVIDGVTRVRDPGTYCYSPFPERRFAYRSAAAHHVPKVAGREPARAGRDLFDMRGTAEGQCLYFGARGFVGRHAGHGPWVYRQIVLTAQAVEVHDFADGGLVLADPAPTPLPFSPGYGRLEGDDRAFAP